MARIRSIKPEFWKSETIASLPFRDRLTFIGLWSYVDDNGVGFDSYKLISAELFGLEDDPREVRDNTRECLARLADARLITRYTLDGKRYIRITNWDEHQRIDRPNKPRYPLPTAEGVQPVDAAQAAEMDYGTSTAGEDSRNPRATLASVHRLEQWSSGAEEQWSRGKVPADEPPPPPAAETLFPDPPVADAPARDEQLTITQRSKAITDAYAKAEPLCKWPAVNAVVIKAIKSEKFADDEIQAAVLRLAEQGRSLTVETLRIELSGQPPQQRAGKHQPYRNPTDNSIYEGAL